MKQKVFYLGLLVLGIALLLSSCGAPETPECPECPQVDCPEAPDCPACPECAACPESEACPDAEAVLPGIEAAWSGSGHANSEAEAFRHWDEDDPAVVALSCGKCHSTTGYVEFVTTGQVTTESPAADNMGVQCEACHNESTANKDSVVMPSGIELTGLGDESRCMECHQGRHSLVSLNASIAEAAGVEDAADADPDTVYEGLGFANIHYYAAAATKYGTLAKGGGEYAGKTYDGNFAHVDEFDTCIECHNPHTLEVRVDECAECHGEGEPQGYRMFGSSVDYDGDGDIEEGVSFEIVGLQEILFSQLEANGLVYDAHAYPYFFDSAGESFAAWTPRLLRAAYNYQLSQKDPGGFAHGGKYIIQLLYDSIEDLGGDVANLNRDDHGHFRGSAEAFRHWDEDGEVSGSCARCHSAEGLPLFHEAGVNIAAEISNGFQCETCHGGGEWPARLAFESVTFPSGATVTPAEGDESSLCMQCHQGRESGSAVDGAIGELGDNDVMEGQRFLNVHYFAAGATRYGAEAGGGYQYAGKTYVGLFPHVPGFDTCMSCHDAHALEVKTDECSTCHVGVEDVHDIRISTDDFDGDGDSAEGIYGEVDTMKQALYDAIVAFSIENSVTNEVVYRGNYPYWFAANDGEDLVWTPTLLRAAYNYQYVSKDPGGFAHNGAYVLQLLYDSIEAVGGDVAAFTRP
jgi:hypothetical protein